MMVAIPTDDPNGLDASVSVNFARAPFITVVDTDSLSARSYPNQYAQGGGGIGPAVAQWIASLGVSAVIAPSVGPNALGALTSAGISVYSCPPGLRVRDVIEMLRAGQLAPVGQPAVGYGPGGMGMGPSGGMGMGRGWGGGRGGGGWGRRRRGRKGRGGWGGGWGGW
ncbi:MAG: NifB/NifX family molybdenum-iron cluster-binding protein [Candidatus Korarchaeota archaeon]|nr:NifB/NifX family molybdenum-iron cluster-binding protein [Candidatus Korarchaeota archaeon]